MDGCDNVKTTDHGKTLLCYKCGVDAVIDCHDAIRIICDQILADPIGVEEHFTYTILEQLKAIMFAAFFDKTDADLK